MEYRNKYPFVIIVVLRIGSVDGDGVRVCSNVIHKIARQIQWANEANIITHINKCEITKLLSLLLLA